MDKNSLLTNANLSSLRAQVDALVFVLDKESKNKYDKRLIDSVQNIYDKFENHLEKEDFKEFKILVREMSLRDLKE